MVANFEERFPNDGNYLFSCLFQVVFKTKAKYGPNRFK